MTTDQDAQTRLGTLVRDIVANLVDDDGQVRINVSVIRRMILFEVRVAPKDFGKLIGKGGGNAMALRTLMRAFGRKYQLTGLIEIVDPQGTAFTLADSPIARK